MFGDPSVGIVWLLSADVLHDHPVEFTVSSCDLYHRLHERHKILTNFVDARNARHIRRLQWLGFIMVRRVERFGAGSLPFVEFMSLRL